MLSKLKSFLAHHKLISLSILGVLLLVFILVIISANHDKPELIKPRYGEIVESIYGLGKVKTDNIHEIKLGIAATVEQLYVNEGSSVKRGDRLLLLDNGLVFRAPFKGIVTQVNITQNQSVFPQQSILRLEDYTKMYIEVSLEQQGALRVKPGQTVRILFENLRGEHQTGTVESIFSRNDEFLARIEVPSLDKSVLPGMTADISIEVGRKKKALLIPIAAINNGQVKVMRNKKVLILPLKIGIIDGNWAEVVEGKLQENDLLLLKGKP